jgi:putative DNA primase/helicase
MSERASYEFSRLMAPVAIQILGEPNKALSSKTELRWGSRGSFSVDPVKGTWCDHEDGDRGGGVLDFLKAKQNLEKSDGLLWLREQGHLPPAEDDRTRVVATYDYQDENGSLLFQVVRFEPKDFRQRQPDGRGGWIWKMTGVRRVLYRLPEVIAAVADGRTVYIAEGEKGVNAVVSLGLIGTCSPAGAGKWRAEYSPSLRGADVILLPDNDEPGRKHVEQVAGFLHGIAGRTRILALPGARERRHRRLGRRARWQQTSARKTGRERTGLASARS